MPRIDELIVDRRAESRSAAARVEDDGRAGVRGVAVDAEEVATPPVQVVRPGRHVARGRRVRANAFDEYERVLPTVVESVAENRVARALGCKTPVVTGRAGDASGRERVRVRIGRRVNAVAVSPRRAVEVRGARRRVRLVAKVIAEDDGQPVGCVVVHGHCIRRARRLL